MTTKVVHLKKNHHDLIIDRRTLYGNPWSHNAGSSADFIVKHREEAIDCYRDWLLGTRFQEVDQKRRGAILASLHKLRGKALGCWCKPDKSCHGDVLAWLADYEPPASTTIVVTRKPLIGSVADNIQKWGCGPINIDGSRVGLEERTYSGSGASPQKILNHGQGDTGIGMLDGSGRDLEITVSGRWPANLVLSHQPGCVLQGTRQVGSGGMVVGGPPRSKSAHIQQMSEQPRTDAIMSYGEETVEDWDCVVGCAVGDLARQSGIRPSTGNFPSSAKPTSKYRPTQGNYQSQGNLYSDEGTATRYYKQFYEGIAMPGHIPEELISYLRTMISPPGGEVLVVLDPSQIDWDSYTDNQLHGLIGYGDPEPYLEHIWRVVRPGALVLWVAPEEEPVGFEAACSLEDKGFEIRDSICWARRAGGLHYVPKASSAERDAGLGGERCTHPTVKPIELFEKLLADIPEDALILDPFAGSGTTGIACLRTGHSVVLIDQDPEYVGIATRRIRHWDAEQAGWDGADIESDADESELEKPAEFDLFGD